MNIDLVRGVRQYWWRCVNDNGRNDRAEMYGIVIGADHLGAMVGAITAH